MKLLLRINLSVIVCVLILALFIPIEISFSVISGLIISFLFVITAAWVHNKFWDYEEERFLKLFYRSLLIRFFFVIVFLAIFLSLSKIDEIYFTVSFIISYLYNSVAEMILFNKTLTKKSKKR